jgi:hypothetical protein
MPRKRPDPPPVDPIEEDFLLAIERLELRTPREHVLQKNCRADKLSLNKSTVALEAGHSRTKIYDYPRVIARIAEVQVPVRSARTAQDVIGRLRQENALLRREKRSALSALAALTVRMQQDVKKHERRVREITRAARRCDPQHAAVGNVISMRGNTPK